MARNHTAHKPMRPVGWTEEWESWLQICLMNLIGFGWQSLIMANVQAGDPIHAMLCDSFPMTSRPLPNDRTKDGIPDYFFLHPFKWS
jgi:hypothetical protein